MIVIGAGFGGLSAARALERPGVQVVVIDANNFHTFQPLLYQVATAGLDADDICFPVRAHLRKRRGTRFVLGAVTAIDLVDHTVTVDGDRVEHFDHLVVAAGSVSATFGVEGVDEHTFPLKTAVDALALRAHLLGRFEAAAASVDGDIDLGIAVVGGGPTGVEMAGGLRELIDKVLRKDYPELDLRHVPITLVEAADRVLGPFHPSLSEQARSALEKRRITVQLGVGVARVEPDAVVLADGRRVPAGTIVWATGVSGSPVGALLGVPLARGNRVPVAVDLSLPGHPNVFVIGDLALPPGTPLPQVAQPAIQGGAHVARQIHAQLDGRPTEPFVYRDKGSMATIGRNQAVAELPNGWKFHGFIGWLMWLGLHLVELMGFRNRANVLVNWAWNYVTYDRGSRMLLSHPPEASPHD
ncbi:MAG: NAD(P)/FAD-dependent oxidoreductase [Actinomycetota bacterium]|nr:NAD(P)/FAD-dependent oxidoreductase [Actinomycetota bacterium]